MFMSYQNSQLSTHSTFNSIELRSDKAFWSERMTALYGTSFENLEDEERDPVSKKPTGIQDQVATDERGRRRFHGAFTGGFSAGYFNTVGSKHGWAPTEFRSTRDERPDNGRQRAEDFMDDEDLGEFGISSRRIRQTKEFSTGSTLAWERGTTSTQSTVEGIFAKDLQVAIKPVSDSIGIRMLREMGWRQGRAVGLTTIREAKKHRNLNDVDREQITKVAPHWVAAAEDEEVIHMDPLEGIKGLGYSGELKGSDLLNQKYGQGATMLKGKKGKGITGQAFGVGAFEDEDESVYTSFDLSQYDFALGPAAAEKRDNAPDSSFIPAKSVLSSRKFYGAPKIPPTFKGIHTTKTLDASVLPSRMKTVVEGLNSEQRALFLGENRQTAEGGIRIKKKSRWDIKGEEKEDDRYSREEEDRRREREESRHAEHAKRIEYPQDENKQRRFREYLNYVRRGLAMPPPADISRWEWEKEEIEFESKLLADERALLPDVRARTKPLAKSALALPILDMMRSKFIGETNTPHATSTRDEDRMLAVKSEMFGDKTRVKFEWHPAYGLAKLFNVPNPYPGSSIHGLAHLQNKGKKREENVLSTIGLPSTAAEFAMNAGMIDDKRKDDEREERRKERDREEREERRSDTKRERDRYDKDEKKRREEEDEKDKENKGDEEEEEERAPDNLLAAIFGMESSDESEDEDDNKDNGKNTIVLPSTSNPIEKPKPKGDEKEEIIRIMDMEDEFGPAPPPGLNQTEGLTGFSVLRFNDEVMKKMKKRKRKINDRDDEREKDEKEKKKKSKKSKKEKKSSKKKHKKEKKESKSRRKSITVSSDDSSSDSSVQALD